MLPAGPLTDRVVALTPAGRSLIDRAFTEHMRNERMLLDALDALDAREAGELERLLTAWLAPVEPVEPVAGKG